MKPRSKYPREEYQVNGKTRWMIRGVETFVPQVRGVHSYTPRELHDMVTNANTRVEYGAELPVLIHHKPNKEIPKWKRPIRVGYLRNFRVKNIQYPVSDKNGILKVRPTPCIIADLMNLEEWVVDLIDAEYLADRSIGLAPKHDSPDTPERMEVDHLALLTPSETPWMHLPRMGNNESFESKNNEIINFEFNIGGSDMGKQSATNKKIDEKLLKVDDKTDKPVNFEADEAMKKKISDKISYLVEKEGMAQDQAVAVAHSMAERGELNESEEDTALENNSNDDKLVELFTQLVENQKTILERLPEPKVENNEEEKKEEEKTENNEEEKKDEEKTEEKTEEKKVDILDDKEETKEEKKEDKEFDKEQEENKKKSILPLEQFESQLNTVNFENYAVDDEVPIVDKSKMLSVYKAIISGSFEDTMQAFSTIFPNEPLSGYKPVNFESGSGLPDTSDWNKKDEKGKSPSDYMAELHPNKDVKERKKLYYKTYTE